MPLPSYRLTWIWRLLPGVVSSVAIAGLLHIDALRLNTWEYRTLFGLRGPQPWESHLVLIAIDDASLQQLGRFPWSRERYAELIQVLTPAQPSVIAVNLIFSEPTPNDAALAEAMAQQGSVVLAQAWDSEGHLLQPVPQLQQAAIATGHLQYHPESDGIPRVIEPALQGHPSFAIAAAQAYILTTKPVSLPSSKRHLWISWPGPAQTLPQYSFASVLQGQVPAAAFSGKVVLVGVTATGIDPLLTPYNTTLPASGVYLHAAALDNLLQHRFLQPIQSLVAWSLILLLGPLVSYGLVGRRQRHQLLITAAIILVWIGLAIALFRLSYWLPISAPVLLLGMTGLGAGLVEQFREGALLNHQIANLWRAYHRDIIISPGFEQTFLQTGLPTRVRQLAAIAEQFGRSQSTQATLARHLSLGLLAADLQGRVWFCNPVATRWLHIHVGDDLAQRLVPGWLSAETWQQRWQSMVQGTPQLPYEFERHHHWFEMRLERILPITGEAQAEVPSGCLLILEDITHRKQIETALRHLNQTLEEQVQHRTQQLEQVNRELQQEIQERRQMQDQLAYDAFHDGLTGLPNRNAFLQSLETAAARLQRSPDPPFAVLFLDCDRFKLINDSFGHWMGDELLKAVSQRLRGCIRPRDVIARFGGDEFTVLLPEVADAQEAVQITKRIRQRLGEPFAISQEQIFTNASIGIVIGTADYRHSDEILRDADTAMYRAKTSGSGYALFEEGMHVQVQNSLRLETELRLALERQELRLHYQPIMALNRRELIGLEALLRWQHPERGLIAPDLFVPLAEETGLILPIGQWVLQEACQQLYQWQQQQLISRRVLMSVNLSVTQFTQPDLIRQIDDIVQQSHLDSQCLKLEITESAIMADSDLTETVFQALRDRRIKLSIDDFGTGYSSLSYLHRFPVDVLKIDRSFVSQIDSDRKQFGITAAIIQLAQHLDMKVIAEGIERSNQVSCLKTLGCQFGQGYLFSRPLANADLQPLLSQLRS